MFHWIGPSFHGPRFHLDGPRGNATQNFSWVQSGATAVASDGYETWRHDETPTVGISSATIISEAFRPQNCIYIYVSSKRPQKITTEKTLLTYISINYITLLFELTNLKDWWWIDDKNRISSTKIDAFPRWPEGNLWIWQNPGTAIC